MAKLYAYETGMSAHFDVDDLEKVKQARAPTEENTDIQVVNDEVIIVTEETNKT